MSGAAFKTRDRRLHGNAIPDPASIGICLRTVEIELKRGNKERAIAAIERVFAKKIVPITDDSPVYMIGLQHRTANALDKHGIQTLGQLKAVLEDDIGYLWKIENFGPQSVQECTRAVAVIVSREDGRNPINEGELLAAEANGHCDGGDGSEHDEHA